MGRCCNSQLMPPENIQSIREKIETREKDKQRRDSNRGPLGRGAGINPRDHRVPQLVLIYCINYSTHMLIKLN